MKIIKNSFSSFSFIFLFIILFFSSIISSSYSFDVEWIFQVRKITGDGFFFEFLGYQSSFQTLLPQLRLSKGFNSKIYNKLSQELKNENEDDIIIDPMFLNSLNQQEKESLLNLISNKYNLNSNITYLPSFFGKIQSFDESLCSTSSLQLNNNLNQLNYNYIDLSKSLVDNINQSYECCLICLKEPLCIGWEYGCSNTQTKECKLKGQRLSIKKSTPISSTSTSSSSSSTVTNFQSNINTNSLIQECSSDTFISNVSTIHTRYPVPRFRIFHGTKCFYQNQSVKNIKKDINTIFIGRYMFEKGVDGIQLGLTGEEFEILECLHFMDEVWVPTEWNKDVFTQLSTLYRMKLPPIYVIPEAVNTQIFTSNLNTCSSNDIQSTIESNNSPFQFLSIFKWEDRKGWDLLLKAYWNTFTREDNVVLRLQTYRPIFLSNENNITETIITFAKDNFGKNLSELAQIHLGNANYDHLTDDNPLKLQSNKVAYLNGYSPLLTRDEIRSLYLSSNVFVLPTRGEGWGLPIIEAMSLGLPVIVTNYSGPTAYTTSNNSFLIPVEINSLTNHAKVNFNGFVIPSIEELQNLMLFTYQNPLLALQKGKIAQETVLNFSSDKIVSMMIERMKYHISLRGWNS